MNVASVVFGKAGLGVTDRHRRFSVVVVTVVLALVTVAAGTAHAASTASISGTITNSSGKPITTQDICIEAYPASGSGSFGEATTNASGNYDVTGLSAGSYDVYVYDCGNDARNDVPAYYSTSPDGSATPITLTAGEAKTGIDVALKPATSISGHVYGGPGTATPLSDACVTVSDAKNSYQDDAGYASTNEEGAYTVDHLTPGAGYKVEFSPCSSNSQYAAEYYDGKSTFADADTVAPTSANPSKNIDGHLPVGSSISGTVTDSSGRPITTKDICVGVTPYGSGAGGGETTTDSSGSYSVTGLSAGSYYVDFADCADSSRNDVAQYYGGSPDEQDSTLVVLSAGGAKAGINAKMAAGTSITGHAYAGSGTATPLGGVCVEAYSAAPSGTNNYGYYSYFASTDGSGAYSIKHVAPVSGGYTVEFTDCNSPVRYVSQFYGGTYDPSTARPVKPTVATPATGINAHLQFGGSITGTVTDSAGNPITSGVCATADKTSGGAYYSGFSNTLSPSGTYTIGGLPSGAYSATFYDCGTRNDVAQTLSKAISVTVGKATSGVDVSMQPATSISGHVYGGAGTSAPLANICVEALSPNGESIQAPDAGFVSTAPDGSYTLEHLPPSTDYVVEFNTCSYYGDGYATQYYDGVSDLSQADKLDPTVAQPSSGIDAHLPNGAPVTTITGGPAANAATNQTDARFSFTANAAAATFECALDGSAYSPCTSPYDTGTLSSGHHTFTVEAIADGQTEKSPPYVTWTVDPSSPTSTSQGEVTDGGTFSSDPGGSTSPSTPVIVDVTPPSASQVTLTTEPSTTASGDGYTIFGQQVDISAADPDGTGSVTGTASDPIKVAFELDASQIPAGTDVNTITLTRDGTPAPNCAASDGSANPDPCVESRTATTGGGVDLVILTTHCSIWNFAVTSTPTTTTTTTPTGPTPPPPTSSTPTSTPITLPAGQLPTGQVTAPHTGPAVPTTAQIKSALGAVLKPTGRLAKIARLLKNSGYTYAFKAPSAGRLTIDWYYLPKGAHIARKAKARPVLIASVSAVLHKAGKTKIKVKLTGKGRKALKRAKSLKLTAKATFTPSGGKATSRTQPFRCKR